MPTFELNKLVRTKLPEVFAASGQQVDLETLNDEALYEALAEKLLEELALTTKEKICWVRRG